MAFGLSTLCTQVALCSSMLLLFASLLSNRQSLKTLGFLPMFMCMVSVALRLVLPFEWWYTRTIPKSGLYPVVWTFLGQAVFDVNGMTILLDQVILAFVCIVSLILFLHLLIEQRRHRKYLEILPVHSTVTYTTVFGKDRSVSCVIDPNSSNALVIGLVRLIIVMPGLPLTEKEWDMILQHELSHIRGLDIWIKYTMEVVCILNWWNPLILLLRRNMTAALEMRADDRVTGKLNDAEKIEYLECLLKIARTSSKKGHAFSLGLTNHAGNALRTRFELIINSGKKSSLSYVLAFSLVMIILLSTSIVFEPYSIPEDVESDSFRIAAQNAYLVIAVSGGYDLYMDDTWIGHTEQIDETFSDLHVYNNLEEVIR